MMTQSLRTFSTFNDGHPMHNTEHLESNLAGQCQEIDLLRGELRKERELRETEERLIKMILHDLCTSLSVVRASCYLVDKFHDRLSQNAITDHLMAASNQATYIGDLLGDISTVISTHRPPTAQFTNDVDLKALTKSCIEQLSAHNPKAVHIVTSSAGNLDKFTADVNVMRSIIINLLSNAVKYSPGKSLVDVGLHGTAEEIVLTVSDHGIGIAAEEIEHVFDPFYRASNALRFTGSGLGLAIVKKAVDSLGGTISVESEVNIRTVFTIRLPRNGRYIEPA